MIVTVSIIVAVAILYFAFAPTPEVSLRKDINKNPEKYQRIVQAVFEHKNQLPSGKLVDYKRIPATLRNELDKVNINQDLHYISVRNAPECDVVNIKLIYGKYEVDYTPCPDTVITQEGDYYKNGFIEVWTINEHWSVMLDSDFI